MRRSLALLLVTGFSFVTACTSDNSATVPPGGSVPPTGTGIAKIVFARITPGGAPVGTYLIQEDGAGLQTLLTGSATGLLGITPSGRLIFSDVTGALVSINADGTGLTTIAPLPPSTSNGPYFCGVTPNNRVVYRYEDLSGPTTDGNVYSRNADGSGAVNTLAGSSANELCAAVHPGGRVIISEFTGNQGLNHDRLYSVSEDGSGSPATLYDGGVRFAGIATGGRVIFVGFDGVTGETIYSANADGTGNATLQANGSWYDGGLWIAPSGRVVYVHYFDDGLGGTQYDLMVVNADGTASQRLTNNAAGEEYFAEAPDGRIVFRCGDAVCSIFPNGTGLQTLTTTIIGTPIVGVTSTNRVIYQYNATSIYSVNTNGTSPATVASVAGPNQVSLAGVSPSGRVIYQFHNGSAGTEDDLYSVNGDGTGMVILANATGNEWIAGVTTNDRIVFTHHTGGQFDLYSIRADGTGRQTLSATTDNDGFAGIFY